MFSYSPKTSDQAIAYLYEKNFLTEADTAALRAKAAEQKSTAYAVFLKEHPDLAEKSARLIAHLLNKPYREAKNGFTTQEDPLISPARFAEFGALVVSDGGIRKILCLDPQNPALLSAIAQGGHQTLPLEVISEDHLKAHDARAHHGKSRVSIVDTDDAQASDANKFVFEMLKECVERGASDIHIDLALDPQGQAGFKLRYRVDGLCHDIRLSSDMNLYRGIVNKLKLDAGLKIDERRLPQDGRISFELSGKVYNFRLSLMPNTIRNSQEEKIVLRQMADVTTCDLYHLDLLDYDLKYLEESLKYPHGFICVTGPTGSGKTTLLYALLKQIDRTGKNVITLEDPIEAEIPMVNQSQIFHRIGYDFAAGLRVILRQDPNIIMVGEMRDEETALKAFEAANTGHLVFSTLHTNTAASSITRLLQMNVPHYFISSSLKTIVAQRLIRRVCTACRIPHPHEKEVFEKIQELFATAPEAVKTLFEAQAKTRTIYAPYNNGKECPVCQKTRYKGRMAVMEVMKVNDEIRRIINFEHGNEEKIQKAALENGMLSIQQYGYLSVLKGLTTFEEVNTAVMMS